MPDLPSSEGDEFEVSSPRFLPDSSPARHFEKNALKHIDATEDPRKHIKLGELVGKGGFGRVSAGRELPTNKRVAVKRMTHKNAKEKRRNLKEVGVLLFCDHPNIVR